MSVVIRRAEPRDAADMAALDKLCFASPWSLASFEQELNGNKLALYIAAEDEDEGLIGYAGLWAVVDEGHITNIAVHPDYRNRGLGTLLLGRLIAVSEAGGVVRHTLYGLPTLRLWLFIGNSDFGKRDGEKDITKITEKMR